MAQESNIEWTEWTWNVVTGCSKVSTGCKNCYAEKIAKRYWGSRPFTDVRMLDRKLDDPLQRKKPTTYFVNSMSDLFHEDVPDAFIRKVFEVMAQCEQHTFQILTKRAARMLEFMQQIDAGALKERPTFRAPWPLPNVWLGVSVENQRFADERIPLLMVTPAAVRFISAEPLLEEIRLTRYHQHCPEHDFPGGFCTQWHPGVRSLDWVICGGESGPGARPFNLAWAESLLDQCKQAGVPFFMKQLGSKPQVHSCRSERCTHPDCGMEDIKLRDRKGGDMQEWPENLRVREYPQR